MVILLYIDFFQIFQSNEIVIILRVFDTLFQIKKSLKVFFLDRIQNKNIIDEILHLFQSTKTLIRFDIILQIYDTYFIQYKNNYQAYFVIEQENIEDKLLNNEILKYGCPQEIQYVMKTAINYCSDLTNIKLKSDAKKIDFPKRFFDYFYIVKEENGEIKIKLCILSPDIFINPKQKLQDKNNLIFYQSTNIQRDNFQFDQLNQQLIKLEIDTKKLTQIKKENLIQSIKQYGQSLLTYHDIQIFEIIEQHPKYDNFELMEFDEYYFIFSSKIEGQEFLLKAEKFLTLKQLEDIQHKYDLLTTQSQVFVPIENYESIILENHFYLLVFEKIITNKQNLQKDNNQNNEKYYVPLDQKLQLDQLNFKNTLRNLQIIVQIIKFIINQHKYEIYHGQLSMFNIFVKIPTNFNTKPPDLLISNPLFMREKVEQNKPSQFNFEKDFEDIKSIINNIFSYNCKELMDSRAVRQFKNQISIYFQQLIKQSHKEKNIEEKGKNPIFIMIEKLEYFFQIFEDIYNNHLNDGFIKLNNQWLVSLSYYRDEDDYEEDENNTEEYFYQGKSYFTSLNLFDLGIEEINYEFYEHRKLCYEYDTFINSNQSELEYEEQTNQKKNNLISLNIKGLRFENDSNRIEIFFKQSIKLQQLKLEVLEEDEEFCLDLSLLQFLTELKSIKLQLCQIKFNYYYSYRSNNSSNNIFKTYKNIMECLIKLIDDLVLVFKSNKHFIFMDILPNRFLPYQYKDQEDQDYQCFDEMDNKHKFIYEQILNHIVQESQKEKSDRLQIKKNSIILKQDKSQNKQQDQQMQKNNLKRYFQSNQSEKNFNQQQKNYSEKEKSYLQYTEFIQFVTNAQLIECIQNRDTMINQFKQTINSYFKSEQQSDILIDQEQKLLQQIDKLQDGFKYINYQASSIFEDNQQLLILKFKNVLVDDIGKLVIKLFINNSQKLQIQQFDCKNFERYSCQIKMVDYLYFHSLQVIDWMQCQYQSQIYQQLYFKNEKQVCRHYDGILIQKKFYKDQLSLRKLTIHLEFCQFIIEMMMNTVNYFQFEKNISETLIELKLKINYHYNFPKNFYKYFRLNLESVKSLIKLRIKYDRIYGQNVSYVNNDLKISLMKMKRIVMIQIS